MLHVFLHVIIFQHSKLLKHTVWVHNSSSIIQTSVVFAQSLNALMKTSGTHSTVFETHSGKALCGGESEPAGSLESFTGRWSSVTAVGACRMSKTANEKKRVKFMNGERHSCQAGTQAVFGHLRSSGRFERRGRSREKSVEVELNLSHSSKGHSDIS